MRRISHVEKKGILERFSLHPSLLTIRCSADVRYLDNTGAVRSNEFRSSLHRLTADKRCVVTLQPIQKGIYKWRPRSQMRELRKGGGKDRDFRPYACVWMPVVSMSVPERSVGSEAIWVGTFLPAGRVVANTSGSSFLEKIQQKCASGFTPHCRIVPAPSPTSFQFLYQYLTWYAVTSIKKIICGAGLWSTGK